MLDNQRIPNITVMTGNNDDVTHKPSYGWLFSTVTAFGLILFLSLSFVIYHRRLAAKRKKEEEYNSYFQFVRPDLALCDKRITRARSILTNTHYVDGPPFISNENGCYNEAFEDERDNETETQVKVSYAEWMEKRNARIVDQEENENHDIYLRSVQARRKILLADVHTEEMFSESDEDVVIEDDPVSGMNVTDNVERRAEPLDKTVENNHGKLEISTDHMKELRASNLHTNDSAKDEIVRVSRHEIVAHKPPILKPITEMNSNNEEMLKKKATLKPLYPRKKKKRSILSHAYKKQSISLDETVKDSSVFYSEPRRQSEPGLFLYNEEAADPQDANQYAHQNKIVYNPYYTEVSLPVSRNQKKRSFTNEDENEIDAFKNSYELKRERSLPVLDSVYHKHVSASTWM